VLKRDDFPAVAETIEELNERFFLVKNYGNKARVCSHLADKVDARQGKTFFLSAQSTNDFKIGFMNQLVKVGHKANGDPKFDDKASVWLKSAHRREFDRIVFEPQKPPRPGVYNLWKGFAFEPKKGACDKYLAHVRENVCQGDALKYDYLLGWMAYAVRHPGEPGEVAVVIQGPKGVGKNVCAERFADLFGQHGMVVADQGRVTKNFNAHLRDKVVLVCDEAFFAGDRRHEGVLKALITGATLTIEAKGVDAITSPNLLHLLIIGNDAWLVPASFEERRFLVLSCSDQRQQDHKYFQAINDQLRQGGYEALLYHLLYEVDLGRFNVREAPHTNELRAQMSESLRGAESAWFECLTLGIVPGKLKKDGTAELRADTFIEWARKREKGWSHIKAPHVEALFGTGQGGLRFNRVKALVPSDENRYFDIPPLRVARATWDKYRYVHPWPQDGGSWVAPANLEGGNR
jgi:hypothetical protein